MFLVEEWTQWQGDVTTGTLLDKEDAEAHIAKMLGE
jgi:hypothetical protein